MRKLAYVFMLLTVFVINAGAVQFVAGDFFLTVGRLVAIPLIISWAVYTLAKGGFRSLSPFHKFGLAWIAWCCFSVLWASDPDWTYISITRLIPIYLVSVIIWDLCRNKLSVEGALQAFLLGPYLSLIFIVRNYLQNRQVYEQRFSGEGFDPNEQCFFVVLGVAIAWYLATRPEPTKLWLRIINYGFPLVAAGVILLTASRGGMVAAVPSYLYILFTLNRMPKKARAWVYGGGAVAIVIALAYAARSLSFQFERLSSVLASFTTDKFTGRTDIWVVAVDVWTKHPIFGVGAGDFRVASAAYNLVPDLDIGLPAHNMYLSILSETGLVGMGLFLGGILSIIVNLRRFAGQERWAYLAAMLTFIVGAIPLTIELRQQVWIFLSLMASLPFTAEAMARRAPARPEATAPGFPRLQGTTV